MRKIVDARLTIVVAAAVASLAVAVAGSALAGPSAGTSISSKKVKKLIKKGDKKTLKKANKNTDSEVAKAKTEAGDALAAAIPGPGVVKASKGETKPVVTHGPFEWELRCGDSGGDPDAMLVMIVGEEGVVVDGGDGPVAVLGLGAESIWSSATAPGPLGFGDDFSFAAPSGATMAGNASTGVNMLGADCAAWVTSTAR